MYFYKAADRKSKEIVPGGIIRTFWGDNTLLSVVDLEPNVEVPLHTHPQEQSGMVLEGQINMGIAGESRTLKTGDIYIIPGGIEHSAKTSSTHARVLDIFSPVREDYKY